MTSHESGGGSHSRAKLAAEIGSVAGIGIAGAIGYLAYRKHRLANQRSFEAERVFEFEEALAIFDEPRLDESTKTVMAAVAVRVYHAAELTFDPIINRDKLLELFEERYGAQFREQYGANLNRQVLQRAVSYLVDYGLIAKMHRPDNPRSHGYIAAPALNWAMEGETANEFLVQAEMDLLGNGDEATGSW